jgi:hypothetical protein
MLSDWENKYRQHWPHHYRDVLDKINSALGMVVVSDTENHNYSCDRPVVRLERSFKLPTTYKMVIQDPLTSRVLEEHKFNENQLEESIEAFVETIGGWGQQPY